MYILLLLYLDSFNFCFGKMCHKNITVSGMSSTANSFFFSFTHLCPYCIQSCWEREKNSKKIEKITPKWWRIALPAVAIWYEKDKIWQCCEKQKAVAAIYIYHAYCFDLMQRQRTRQNEGVWVCSWAA